MPEERGRGLLLLMVFGIFLWWGIDESWRKEVIRLESLWLIRMLEQRAFDLGTATHEGLRQLLGEFMAQPQGSFGEGLVLGIRMVMVRLGTQALLGPLVLICITGFFHEARSLRAVRMAHFSYTSPLRYRRVRALLRIWLIAAVVLWFAPLPIHPLWLTFILIAAGGSAAWRHASYMKQI